MNRHALHGLTVASAWVAALQIFVFAQDPAATIPATSGVEKPGSALPVVVPAPVVPNAAVPNPALVVPLPAPSETPDMPVGPLPEPVPEPRRVRQPLQEYFTVFDPQREGRQNVHEKVNPFITYTHLGTDFGFIGNGQEAIGCDRGSVLIAMPQGYWAGMWH